MTDETTTEQLAEIDRDMADIERQVAELVKEAQQADYKTQELPEYTPPEGWQLVPLGEPLKGGDEYHAGLDRYIRRIKPEPQPQPEAEPAQVREGRWRTRGGNIRNVTPRPAGDGRKDLFPWWDAAYGGTWTSGGRYYFGEESPSDLVEYLGPIEQQPSPEPQPNAAAIEELRSEVSYVQNLLGESRQQVTQLEELVASLRAINETQEKAFEAAGQHNSDLQSRLNAVCSEWSQQAETIRRLQIELDAAQQVPADSPELRQLRADLAEVTRERDQYLDSYQRIFGDLETIRETTKAETVEAIAEWLEPIRLVDHPNLSNETLQHLPSIMRHLTGLDSHAID